MSNYCAYNFFLNGLKGRFLNNDVSFYSVTDKYFQARSGSAVVNWDEPRFEGHQSFRTHNNILPNQTLQQGSYDIAYVAYDKAGNTAQCDFTVHVLKSLCIPPDQPKNGKQKCEDWGPGGNFKVCRIECNDGYRFSQVSPPLEWRKL